MGLFLKRGTGAEMDVGDVPQGRAQSALKRPPTGPELLPSRRPRRVRLPRRLQPTTKAKSFFTTVVNQLCNLIVVRLLWQQVAGGRGRPVPPPPPPPLARESFVLISGSTCRFAQVCVPKHDGLRPGAGAFQQVASFLLLCCKSPNLMTRCHDLLPWIQ